jgi:hypothetical protein
MQQAFELVAGPNTSVCGRKEARETEIIVSRSKVSRC